MLTEDPHGMFLLYGSAVVFQKWVALNAQPEQ